MCVWGGPGGPGIPGKRITRIMKLVLLGINNSSIKEAQRLIEEFHFFLLFFKFRV
jgi:hypothetical protein